MAFRSSLTPAEALKEAKRLAGTMKSYCAGRSLQFQGVTERQLVLAVVIDLRRWRDQFNTLAQVPGLATYAREQENDANYDVAAEFTAMVATTDAAIGEITATFPRAAGTGEILERTLAVNGTLTAATFTGAQLATLRTRLNAIVAAIA